MDETRQAARFGPFAFDFGERVLRREGTPVPLQPQPLANRREYNTGTWSSFNSSLATSESPGGSHPGNRSMRPRFRRRTDRGTILRVRSRSHRAVGLSH